MFETSLQGIYHGAVQMTQLVIWILLAILVICITFIVGFWVGRKNPRYKDASKAQVIREKDREILQLQAELEDEQAQNANMRGLLKHINVVSGDGNYEDFNLRGEAG